MYGLDLAIGHGRTRKWSVRMLLDWGNSREAIMNFQNRGESLRLILLVSLALLFCEGGCSFFVRSDGGLKVDANATCGNSTQEAASLNGVSVIMVERTIIVDGEGSDWEDMEPLILEKEGDSLCGPGVDLSALFLARDSDALYWRIDGVSVVGTDVEIVFRDHEYGAEHHRVRHEVAGMGTESHLSAAFRDEEWDPEDSGPEFAAAGEVVEGLVPLHLFRSRVYDKISVRLFQDGFPAPCDEATREGEYAMW
jgi:hypothetical protein